MYQGSRRLILPVVGLYDNSAAHIHSTSLIAAAAVSATATISATRLAAPPLPFPLHSLLLLAVLMSLLLLRLLGLLCRLLLLLQFGLGGLCRLLLLLLLAAACFPHSRSRLLSLLGQQGERVGALCLFSPK